jgi:anti-anti-sigma regulatory factor
MALDRTVAGDLHARFLEALGGASITLDGSRVERVDVAGVQLLCALMIAAGQRGVQLGWTAVSPALSTCARLLGVRDMMRLDGVRQEGLEWFD